MRINHTRDAPTLIGNYVKVAARNLMRNKAYSTLNILGLGIAMSCCLLIVLFLQHELQYDQFYTKGDRIYKVVRETYGQEWKNKWHTWAPVDGWRPIHTYVVLQKGVNPKTLEQKLPEFMARYMGAEIRKHNTYHLQPLRRVYLYSRADYGIKSFGDRDPPFQVIFQMCQFCNTRKATSIMAS